MFFGEYELDAYCSSKVAHGVSHWLSSKSSFSQHVTPQAEKKLQRPFRRGH
jgi:hypothetical protein